MSDCKLCNDRSCPVCQGDTALRNLQANIDGARAAFMSRAMIVRGYYEAFVEQGFAHSDALALASSWAADHLREIQAMAENTGKTP